MTYKNIYTLILHIMYKNSKHIKGFKKLFFSSTWLLCHNLLIIINKIYFYNSPKIINLIAKKIFNQRFLKKIYI